MGCTTSVSPNTTDEIVKPHDSGKRTISTNVSGNISGNVVVSQSTHSSSENSAEIPSSGLVYTAAVDNSGNLFAAIKRGDVQTVTDLLLVYEENLANRSTNSSVSNSPKATTSVKSTKSNLFTATGNSPMFKGPSLLITSANVNKLLGMWNSTPLIVATQYAQTEIAAMLLGLPELGDLNHLNDKGASALTYACMEGMTEIVKSLLAHGAEVSLKPTSEVVYNQLSDSSVRCTPYSIAVSNGHQSIAAALIDAGENSVVVCFLLLDDVSYSHITVMII